MPPETIEKYMHSIILRERSYSIVSVWEDGGGAGGENVGK